MTAQFFLIRGQKMTQTKRKIICISDDIDKVINDLVK